VKDLDQRQKRVSYIYIILAQADNSINNPLGLMCERRKILGVSIPYGCLVYYSAVELDARDSDISLEDFLHSDDCQPF
jgi:hypothetical protein